MSFFAKLEKKPFREISSKREKMFNLQQVFLNTK